MIYNNYYKITYPGNTYIIGKYIEEGDYYYKFEHLVHYWNNYPTFYDVNPFCAKDGIIKIEEASIEEINKLNIMSYK